MDGIGENIKKILLAGIGAVATTTEKSKELLDEMVKKGELTVEQGKVLNEELKHNIKKTMKRESQCFRESVGTGGTGQPGEDDTRTDYWIKRAARQLDQQEGKPEAEKTDTSRWKTYHWMRKVRRM